MKQRAKARRARQRRIREGGLRYFEPANDRQRAVLECARKGCLVLGGNRSGKTVLGAVETVARHTGEHPLGKRTHTPPIRSWCVSQKLPGATDKPHVQLEEIRRWTPVETLRGGSWGTAYSPGSRTLHWANGGVTEFKSYDQNLLAFESWKGHWIWFDEEPTRKEIFTSCLMRLVDYGGQWMMTLTPVLSLQGKSWCEELWERRGDPEIDFERHQLLTTENRHLDPAEVERTFANLTDEERQVRAFGTFARVGGRVLSEFDPGRHVVAAFVPPREWRHYLVLDPGFRNATAGLFAAADPDGRLWLYGEHYEKEWLPARHVATLHGLWERYGRPEYDVLMDPAGFSLKRTTTGRESPSDADEYRRAAAEIGATWLRLRPANNGDPFALRVKRYLAADRLRVCGALTWWRWEAERWTYQKDREALSGGEASRERPVDRDNHLMDCTRYLVNELPDPMTSAPGPAERSPEHFVRQHLENVLKRKKRGQWG